MDLANIEYAPLALSFTHVVLGVVVLVLARYIKDWCSPYSLTYELTERDNPAFGIAVAGYYAAAGIIYIGAGLANPLPLDEGSSGVFRAIALNLAWAVEGILALNLLRSVMDAVLVSHTHNSREVIEHRNLAAGALEAGGYLAAGLVLAAAIRQPGAPLAATAVFFALAIAALILSARLYQRFSGYDVPAEIRSGNLSAGLAAGMTLVALALLMVKALSGEFVSWPVNLSFFVFDVVAGVALLRLTRWIADLVLLPDATLPEEIARDHNINGGLIEGVLVLVIAAIILWLF